MTDKTPRKKAPAYHVFRAKPDGSWLRMTDAGNPAKATSREAAIEAVAGKPRESGPDDEVNPVYLVVLAEHLHTLTPRVKVERTVCWEPLPPDPSALSAQGSRPAEHAAAAASALGTKGAGGDA